MEGHKQLPVQVAAAALLLVPSLCLASAEGAADHAPGGIASDLSIWGLVAFIGFLWAVKVLGWEALTNGMRDREASERQLLANADRLRDDAAVQFRKNKGLMEAVDEQIREMLAEADRDATHTRSDIATAGKREADLIQARAELEIGRARDQSLNDIFEEVARRLLTTTEDRIRAQLSATDQQRLVDYGMSEFLARNSN